MVPTGALLPLTMTELIWCGEVTSGVNGDDRLKGEDVSHLKLRPSGDVIPNKDGAGQVDSDSQVAPFTWNEVCSIFFDIFDMLPSKASGLDGFQAYFCQHHWEVVGEGVTKTSGHIGLALVLFLGLSSLNTQWDFELDGQIQESLAWGRLCWVSIMVRLNLSVRQSYDKYIGLPTIVPLAYDLIFLADNLSKEYHSALPVPMYGSPLASPQSWQCPTQGRCKLNVDVALG
ncbi:hypothetical protein ACOSQ2_014541 [Xanthoceras sorbifolium]